MQGTLEPGAGLGWVVSPSPLPIVTMEGASCLRRARRAARQGHQPRAGSGRQDSPRTCSWKIGCQQDREESLCEELVPGSTPGLPGSPEACLALVLLADLGVLRGNFYKRQGTQRKLPPREGGGRVWGQVFLTWLSSHRGWGGEETY